MSLLSSYSELLQKTHTKRWPLPSDSPDASTPATRSTTRAASTSECVRLTRHEDEWPRRYSVCTRQGDETRLAPRSAWLRSENGTEQQPASFYLKSNLLAVQSDKLERLGHRRLDANGHRGCCYRIHCFLVSDINAELGRVGAEGLVR